MRRAQPVRGPGGPSASESASVNVRPMLPSDVTFVVALHAEPGVAAYLNAPDRELVQRTLENPQRVSYIVEAGGRPVGMLLVGLLEPWLIEVHCIAILDPRCGYGRAALRWTLDDAHFISVARTACTSKCAPTTRPHARSTSRSALP